MYQRRLEQQTKPTERDCVGLAMLFYRLSKPFKRIPIALSLVPICPIRQGFAGFTVPLCTGLDWPSKHERGNNGSAVLTQTTVSDCIGGVIGAGAVEVFHAARISGECWHCLPEVATVSRDV